MASVPTIYVLATSAPNAERHASLRPEVWPSEAASAHEWLARWQADVSRHFKVFEVTRRDTRTGPIWTAIDAPVPVPSRVTARAGA